jgi:hypothetical protein
MKKTRSPLLIPGFVVGGVGLVGVGVFGLLAIKEKNIIEGKDGKLGLSDQPCVLSDSPELSALPQPNCTSNGVEIGDANQLAFHDSFKKQKNLARVSDGALILSAVGAGVGVFALVTQKKRTSSGKIEEKLQVAVGLSGVSVAAKF